MRKLGRIPVSSAGLQRLSEAEYLRLVVDSRNIVTVLQGSRSRTGYLSNGEPLVPRPEKAERARTRRAPVRGYRDLPLHAHSGRSRAASHLGGRARTSERAVDRFPLLPAAIWSRPPSRARAPR